MRGGTTVGKYNAIDIAKYIISKCTRDDKPISNLQLQKILYFIQRDYLKNNKYPLFEDDIEAWQFGPVVPEVYYAFCGMGSMKIIGEYITSQSIDDKDKVFIDAIVETKRVKTPWALVEESHTPGGAWDAVYQNGIGDHKVIPKTEIMYRG